MLFRTITGLTFATIAFTATAMAANMPEGWSEPTVAHEGTRVMNASGHVMESTYRYLPPGKHREEMNHDGMSMAMIIRQDLGVVWTVLPGGMHMEISIDEADKDAAYSTAGEGIVEFEKLGTEQVNGLKTTRYRVLTREDGEEAEGYFWVTDDWITVRMEMETKDSPGEKVVMEIKDLQIRDQDPALFEIPPGSTKLSGLGGLAGFGGQAGEGGGMFGFGGELAEEAGETARDTAKQETRDGVKNAVRDGVRGLFKR
jgi:hypothetical protein